MNKRVALVVDNPLRDLPGMVLVARHLSKAGVTSYLVPFNLQEPETWALMPDFVLLNYLRPNNEPAARMMRSADIQIGIHDTEGGVLEDLESYNEVQAQDDALRRDVAVYCSWGPHLAEHVVSSRIFDDEQVVVTGSPRFDYYSEPWSKAASNMFSRAVSLNGEKLVLINSNFSIANPRFGTSRDVVNIRVHQLGQDPVLVESWRDAEDRALHMLAELANALAERFPDVTFVFRPHPFERSETYDDILDKRANLRLIKVGPVDGWIMASEAVIQRSCSTAIEAGLAGVPALLPSWIPTPFNRPATEVVSIDCGDRDELFGKLEVLLSGTPLESKETDRQLAKVIDDWFYKIDGRAHERIAYAILDSLGSKRDAVRKGLCRELAYGILNPRRSWHWRARARARSVLRRSVHWSFLRWRDDVRPMSWDQTEKYFDEHRVREILDEVEIVTAGSGAPSKSVTVQSALDAGEYHFGYGQGRAVVVYPAG